MHECSSSGTKLPLYVDNELFNEPFTTSLADSEQKVVQDAALAAIGQGKKNEAVLSWPTERVESCLPSTNLNISMTQDEESCLVKLLAKLSYAASESTESDILFNGIRIVLASGLSSRIELKDITTSGESLGLPLMLLHLGTPRKLNVIPRTFTVEAKECFATTLQHFSVITVGSETKKRFKVILPMEALDDANRPSFNLLLIPFVDETIRGLEEGVRSHDKLPDMSSPQISSLKLEEEHEHNTDESASITRTGEEPHNDPEFTDNTSSNEVTVSDNNNVELVKSSDVVNESIANEEPVTDDSDDSYREFLAGNTSIINIPHANDKSLYEELQGPLLVQDPDPESDVQKAKGCAHDDLMMIEAPVAMAHSSGFMPNENPIVPVIETPSLDTAKNTTVPETTMTPGKSPCPNIPKPIREHLFLDKETCMDVIGKLNANAAKSWAKECGIPVASTASDNRKLLAQRITSATLGVAVLPAKFLEKLVSRLNDAMVSVELYNLRLTAKNNAKARKNKLLEHLIANFTNLDIKERNESHVREQSFLNKSTTGNHGKKRRKVKRSMKPDKTSTILEESAKAQKTNTVMDSEESKPPLCQNDAPDPCINAPEAIMSVRNDDKNGKSNTAISASNSETDIEKPIMILQNSVTNIVSSVQRNEAALVQLSSSMVSATCGLTRVESQELQQKVTELEKNGKPVMKALSTTQRSLNDLGNVIHALQQEVRDLKTERSHSDRALTELRGEFNRFREATLSTTTSLKREIESLKLKAQSSNETTVSKKKETNNYKQVAKNSLMTPPLRHTITIEDSPSKAENRTDHVIVSVPENQIPDKPTLSSRNGTQFSLYSQNPWGEPNAEADKMKTVSTQPNKVDDNRKKDTKPHPTGKAGNSRDGRLDKTVKKDPPPSRSRTTDNHTVPEWPATADPSIAEKNNNRCLLIHDGTFERFEPKKFSRNDTFNIFKMPQLSTVLDQSSNIITKIGTTNADVVYIHVGFQDLWKGDKVGNMINNIKPFIYRILEKTKAGVCLSSIIPPNRDSGYPVLAKDIAEYNQRLSSLISKVRSESENYRNRIFTVDNGKLADFCKTKIGSYGQTFKLTDWGDRQLWSKLRYGISRTIGIAEPKRETYRRSQAAGKRGPGEYSTYSDRDKQSNQDQSYGHRNERGHTSYRNRY